MCWPGGQHLLLAINQIAGGKSRQLEPVPMRNRIRRTRLHAIPTKNTPVVIDVVDAGVALGAAHAVFGGVVGSLDIDAVRRAIGGAEKTGDALFQAVFVALQDMGAAKAGFDAGSAQGAFAVGIVLHRGGLEHLHEGDAHAFGDGGDIFQDRHAFQYTVARSNPAPSTQYLIPSTQYLGPSAWRRGSSSAQIHTDQAYAISSTRFSAPTMYFQT